MFGSIAPKPKIGLLPQEGHLLFAGIFGVTLTFVFRIREHTLSPNTPRLLVFPEGTCVNNEYVVQFKRGGAVSLCAFVCICVLLPTLRFSQFLKWVWKFARSQSNTTRCFRTAFGTPEVASSFNGYSYLSITQFLFFSRVICKTSDPPDVLMGCRVRCNLSRANINTPWRNIHRLF